MQTPDNVWAPGSDALAADAPRPVLVSVVRRDDDGLPAVLDVLNETIEGLKADFGGMLLTGLPTGLGVFLASLVVPFLVLLSVIPGILLDSDPVMLLGVLATTAVAMGALMALWTFGCAGIARAVHANIAEGAPLGWKASLGRPSASGKVLGVNALELVLSLVGMLFCYLPGLLVSLLLGFALPAALEGRSTREAIRLSVAHTKAHPMWHVRYWALGMDILIVAQSVPVVGLMVGIPFYYAYQIRTYRHVFGPGEGDLTS